MRISDWSSDVCSSDLGAGHDERRAGFCRADKGHYTHCIPRGLPRCAPSTNTPAAARHLYPDAPKSTAVQRQDRKSVVQGTSVAVRVHHGGRRIIKKKKITTRLNYSSTDIQKKT